MRLTILAGVSLMALSLDSGSAFAEDGDARLRAIEMQIKALNAEVLRMKHEMTVRSEQFKAAQQQAAHAQSATARNGIAAPSISVPAGYALVPAVTNPDGSVTLVKAEEAPSKKLPPGTFDIGGVRVTLGGFIEAAGIYRTRNEVSDITSNFNTGIPLPNSQLYHENELRFSARQSRFSMEAQGNPDEETQLTAYFEGDLLGAAPTANSNESNSYNPRVRHAFAVYERSDLGLYFLGGQTWSLLTMDKSGIAYLPSGVNTPLTIDAQYVPGFDWARQPQFRVVKSFDHDRFWLGLSVENPQTTYYSTTAPSTLGTVNVNNDGISALAPTVAYSSEFAPDVIIKGAVDPGWGHFEAYGLASFEHDRQSALGSGADHTTVGGGGGAAALIPIIPKLLTFQASFLAGRGIGRYGTSQLPDAIIGPDGSPQPLSEVMGLVGLIAHPVPAVDLYAYGGTEQVGRRYYNVNGKAYGYGNPLYNNSSCEVELGPSADCVANTSGVVQGTIGAWWRFEKGPWGTMQIGPQYSYTHRSIYSGVGPTPHTDDNMVFLSFRYYPFQ